MTSYLGGGGFSVDPNATPSGGETLPQIIFINDYDVITLFIIPDLSKFRLFLGSGTYNGYIGWVDGEDIFSQSISILQDVYYTMGLDYIYDNKMYTENQDYAQELTLLGHEVQAQAAVPTCDVPSGEVASGTLLHLSSSEAGATIYYVIVYNSPEGECYQEYDSNYPPEITSNCTVRVVAKVANKLISEELVLTFTVA